MPTFEDIVKSDLSKGVAIGLGVALAAVTVVPVLVTASRPLARVAIKSGLLLLEKGREAMAEAGESLEDLVAEVKAEIAEEREGLAGAVDTHAPQASDLAEG